MTSYSQRTSATKPVPTTHAAGAAGPSVHTESLIAAGRPGAADRVGRPLRAVTDDVGTHRSAARREPLADITDAQLIATWQQFRKAMGSVDSALAASLTAADSPNALIHEALAALAAAPSRMLPMSELARVLGLSTGGLTKLVDRLIRLNFAYRHHSAVDRRVIYAALTDAGAAHEQRSTHDYATGLRTELAVLGSRRLAALRQLCDMIEHRPTAATRPTTHPVASAHPGSSARPAAHPRPPYPPSRRYPRVDDGG